MIINLVQNPVFQTVIAGVFVFVISQYVLIFIIEPIKEYKKVIAKIDNKLKFYSNVITNPPLPGKQLPENYSLAKKELRELSCELEALYKMLPFWLRFRFKKDHILKASEGLIWLSNATGYRDETGTVNLSLLADDKINEVRKNLRI